MNLLVSLAALVATATAQDRAEWSPPLALFRGAASQTAKADWFAGSWEAGDFHLEVDRSPNRLVISTGRVDGFDNHLVDIELRVEDGVLVACALTRGSNCLSDGWYQGSDAHGTVKISASGKRHWLEYRVTAVESVFGAAKSTTLVGGVHVKLKGSLLDALNSVPEWSAANSALAPLVHEVSESWHANGQLRCSGLIDQFRRRQGVWRTFAANGAPISESVYVDGMRDGLWVGFTDDGAADSIGNYELGVQVGEWVEFSNVSTECGPYKRGIKFGRWERYAGPQLCAHKSYLFGTEFGHARVMREDGTLFSEGVYLDGYPTGWWAYGVEGSDEIETRFKRMWGWHLYAKPARGLAWLKVMFGLREL